MNEFNEFVIILVCAVAVFALYRLVGYVLRKNQRERMKQQGKTISWEPALERVLRGDGFFIIAVSGQNRELRYAPGDLPSDAGSLRDAYHHRTSVVEGYGGRISVPDLKANGTGDRCVELNIEALVV